MKQRVITGTVLVLIAVVAFGIGNALLKILLALVLIMAMHEIYQLRDDIGPVEEILYDILFVILFALYDTSYLFKPWAYPSLLMILLTLAIIFQKPKLDSLCLVYTFGLVITGGLHALMALSANLGFHAVAFLFLATYGCDTGAYFTGMLIGKTKLTPISPKKTVEGALGGMLAGVALAFVYELIFPLPDMGLAPWLIALIFTITGQLGDLAFSLVKRNYHIKDYSNLLPGHGGVLDRLDSLLFNALTFAVILSL